MNIEELKNYDTVVFACSGPSLNKVDVFSLGFPVVAISTAVRTITNPHIWIYSDYLNEMHGEEGKQVYVSSDVIKIIQEGKVTNHLSGKNVHTYGSFTSNRTFDPQTHLFDFSRPFARGPHKSITYAIQWAHSIGMRNIIFAGNDLCANSMESKYSYRVKSFDVKKKNNFKKTLDDVRETLMGWYPIAQSKGYNWYSWECGDVFEKIVSKLTPEIADNLKKNIISRPEPVIIKHQFIEENEYTGPPITEYSEQVTKYIQLMSMIKKI